MADKPISSATRDPSIQARAIRLQTAVGAGILLLALGLAVGAVSIPSAAGYAGVGPNFLPWLVAIALAVCGGFLVYEARTGGFRQLDDESGGDAVDGSGSGSGSPKPNWDGFAWMSAGLLLNALLITTIGFIFSCTLCFVLAAQGLRRSGLAAAGLSTLVKDTLIGLCIAAPVFWLFTQFLAINLPGLTQTGWL